MSGVLKEVEIALLQKELSDLRDEVHSLSNEVSGLVEAWKTAGGVVGFIKWLSVLIAAVGIIWAAFRTKLGG